MKSQLEIFARLKPTAKSGTTPCSITEDASRLSFGITKSMRYGFLNNKDVMDFLFHHVFDGSACQEEVFDVVAAPVVRSFLDGYNGTIFAYGQTGSGKTFTMSGAETWQLRGIIPRVLTFLFDEFEKRKGVEYKMSVSFMEIYNENAYDLLDRRNLETPLEAWSKVTLMEDEAGNVHLRGLSAHECPSEQDGIDLLMMGNFVRQVSSTPMNQSSSRSHCVFTISLEGREKSSGSLFVSKLHLVDLAGSERISKSQVEAATLNEAKHINLSLSYLEQVIVALHEKSQGGRTHVPYRNSVMTTILKDSLGGNCRTVMVATMSLDSDNFDETISTARFAQRCGQLENEVTRNEQVDLNVMVKKLEGQNGELSEQLEAYRRAFGPLGNGAPSRGSRAKSYKVEDVHDRVVEFFNEERALIEVGNLDEAQACFLAMRDIYNMRMQEYVEELTLISDKLRKYDDYIHTSARRVGGKQETPAPEQRGYANGAKFSYQRDGEGEEGPNVVRGINKENKTATGKPSTMQYQIQKPRLGS